MASATTTTDNRTTFVLEPELKLGPKLPRSGDAQLRRAWGEKGQIEAHSPAPEGQVDVFTSHNLFASAVHKAFYEHYPLVLSPEVIWVTIAQGLANHVEQNSEALRSKFVEFEGKEDIIISRPEFVKGSSDNDWPGVFPEFEAQIKQRTKAGTTELLACDFSATTPTERVAGIITLMDTVQHYFTYTMVCGCGFPSITLKGTAEDWRKICAKAEHLRDYDLKWWTDALLPVLDQFVLAATHRPDLDFWRSLCNLYGASGMVTGPITGWLQVFFPYLNRSGEAGFGSITSDGAMRRNTGLKAYAASYKAKVNPSNFTRPAGFGRSNGCDGGLELKHIPPGLSCAPFTYKDLATGRTYAMAFMSGVTSLVQHADGSLEPVMGWAVLDRST